MKQLGIVLVVTGLAIGWRPAPARASAGEYPTMAPLADYLMADRAAEIAFARTAAPAALSVAAEVLVVTPAGYEKAAEGRNGFVCLVQRAWFSGLDDKGFWNPKLRAPLCINPEGARSVLPTFLERTRWALAGMTQTQIRARTHVEIAARKVPPPETGTISYMLSKGAYLGDGPHGPWRPHLMFFMPPMPTADWGADLAGTGVLASAAGPNPYTMFYVPVAAWSDGSPATQPR